MALVEQHMPLDYYSNMVNVMVDAMLLKEYLDIYVHDLAQHLDHLHVDPILFLV